MVFGNAQVFGDAQVFENAQVFESAMVFGNAQVFGDAQVFGNALACGKASIFGNASIFENARIFGNALVRGNALVYENTYISSFGVIESRQDFIVFSPIGSRLGAVSFFRNQDKGVSVNCGCFSGTIEEFQKRVAETHGSNKFAKEYNSAIELAKIHILEGKK